MSGKEYQYREPQPPGGKETGSDLNPMRPPVRPGNARRHREFTRDELTTPNEEITSDDLERGVVFGVDESMVPGSDELDSSDTVRPSDPVEMRTPETAPASEQKPDPYPVTIAKVGHVIGHLPTDKITDSGTMGTLTTLISPQQGSERRI